MLFQGRPAWVPLFYGSRRASDTGEHDPRTSFLPFYSQAPHHDEVATTTTYMKNLLKAET